MEFGRRVAAEREIEKSDSLRMANAGKNQVYLKTFVTETTKL